MRVAIRTIVYLGALLALVALFTAIAITSASAAKRPRKLEGCAPTPVPDSCMVPEQCLSCHPNMGRQ